MEAANKEVAEECLSKGYFKEALRLAEMSSQMCRTEEANGENVRTLNRPLAKPCQRQYYVFYRECSKMTLYEDH